MNRKIEEAVIDDFISVLGDQLVCLIFETGVPHCILHRKKKGVFVKTKLSGSLYFVIDPSNNSFYFKLYEPKKHKIRWSFAIIDVKKINLSKESFITVDDLHGLSFEDPEFGVRKYLKFLCDVFEQNFDPKTIQFYRKEKKSGKSSTDPIETPKTPSKSVKKKRPSKREPFTPSPHKSNNNKKKRNNNNNNNNNKKKKKSEECVALFDYKAKTPLELSVKEGDVLKIHGINQEEGFIVGEIINPKDMVISPKSKRRIKNNNNNNNNLKKKNIQEKRIMKGQLPEHYTNHLLDEYKKRISEKDTLELAIKKWEKYRSLQDRKLKKREEELLLRESNVDQDRLEALREARLLRSKYEEEHKNWMSKKKSEFSQQKKDLDSHYKSKREEIMRLEATKRKDFNLREKKLRASEDRNHSQGKILIDKEHHLKELGSKVSRRVKRVKNREKHLNEKENIVDIGERRNKERSQDLRKLEHKLVKKDKLLTKKERELKRREGMLNKKEYGLNVEKEKKINMKLSESQKHQKEIDEANFEIDKEKEKRKNGIDHDTVFLDLLKKQGEIERLTKANQELEVDVENLGKLLEEEKKKYQKISENEKLKRRKEIELMKCQIEKIKRNEQLEVERLKNELILEKMNKEDGGEEEDGLLLRYKNMIKKLRSEKKELVMENLDLQSKLNEMESTLKKNIKKNNLNENNKRKILWDGFHDEEVLGKKEELKRVVIENRKMIRNEQLWFQHLFAVHTTHARSRLNLLAEKIKNRSEVLEHRDTSLEERESELEKKEDEMFEKSRDLEKRESSAPPMSEELEDLKRQKERNEKKESMLKEWESDLKKRENELDEREKLFHGERMKFLNLKRKNMMMSNMVSIGDEEKESEGESPRRVHQIRNKEKRPRRRSAESPGRLEKTPDTPDMFKNNRPRKLSQESPGRLERKSKSPKTDPTHVPEHLRPSFHSSGNSSPRFEFILGRYEHRIKHASRLRDKVKSFEELKNERIKEVGDSPKPAKGIKDFQEEVLSLPSPVGKERVELRKLVSDVPPVPSKSRRLKTDELADIIFSPKMRKEQLKLFEKFQGLEDGDDYGEKKD